MSSFQTKRSQIFNVLIISIINLYLSPFLLNMYSKLKQVSQSKI